jgi:hypothetical protein
MRSRSAIDTKATIKRGLVSIGNISRLAALLKDL